MAITVERLEAEISADPARAIAALAALGKAIDAAAEDRKATIDIDTRESERNVQRLSRELDGMGKSSNRNRASINTLGGEIHVTSRVIQGFGATMAGIQWGTMYAGATLVTGGLSTLAGAAGAAAGALGPLTGLLGAIGPLATVFATGIGTAITGFSGIGAAVQAFTKVQGAASVAQNNSTEAARRLASANRGLTDAYRRVKDAAQGVKDAEAGIIEARKQASRDLVEQRQDAVLSGLSEVEAVLALEDAQKRLRDAQKQTARGASTLTKMTDEFTGKIYEVAFQSVDDTDGTGAPDVAGAKRDVTRAEIELERARRRNADTQTALNEAEAKGVEGSDVVQDSIKRHTAALEDLSRANEAVKDAQARTADAQARLNEKLAGGTAATKAYDAAMAKLGPNARSFVEFLTKEFMPELTKFKGLVQEAMLPPVQEGLKAILGVMPQFHEQAVRFGEIIGTGMGNWLKHIADSDTVALLLDVLKGVEPLMKRLLDAAIPLTDIFLRITEAATPMTTLLVDKMVGGLERLSGWMNTIGGQETMLRFFNNAGKFASLWYDALKPVAKALGGIVTAAMPLAEWMLERMAFHMNALSDKINSASGQTALKQFFEDLKPILSEVGGLIADVVKAFFGQSVTDSSLLSTLGALREVAQGPLKDLLKALNESDFAPKMAEFLGHILDGIGALVKHDGAITTIMGWINGLADGMSRLSEATGGKSTDVILGALTGLTLFKIAQGPLESLKSMAGYITGIKDASGSVSGVLSALTGFGGDDGFLSTKVTKVFVVNMGVGMGGGAPVPGPAGRAATLASRAATAAKVGLAGGAAFLLGDLLSDALEKQGSKDGNRSTTDRLGKSTLR